MMQERVMVMSASRVSSYEPKKIKVKGCIDNNLDFLAARVFVTVSPYLNQNITDSECENLQLELRVLMKQLKKIKTDVPVKGPSI